MERETQRRLLHRAYRVALQSKDPSTQNGAVLCEIDGWAKAEGFNGPPPGVAMPPERWQRPLKYKYVEHAERAALLEAARQGYRVLGLTLVCPWLACCDCARAIIAAGIYQCIGHRQAYLRTPPHWKEDVDRALAMLQEAKVGVHWYDGPIGVDDDLRFAGELWRP